MSNFEELKVQKQLVKERKIEVVENPRFITEARWKQEKKKFSLFPHHHKNESRAAAAIQQPAVDQEQQVQSVSAVPPPSEGSLPSKATGSPSKPSSSPSTFERVVYR